MTIDDQNVLIARTRNEFSTSPRQNDFQITYCSKEEGNEPYCFRVLYFPLRTLKWTIDDVVPSQLNNTVFTPRGSLVH